MQKQKQALFTKLVACVLLVTFTMSPIIQLLHQHEQIDQTIVGKINVKKTIDDLVIIKAVQKCQICEFSYHKSPESHISFEMLVGLSTSFTIYKLLSKNTASSILGFFSLLSNKGPPKELSTSFI